MNQLVIFKLRPKKQYLYITKASIPMDKQKPEQSYHLHQLLQKLQHYQQMQKTWSHQKKLLTTHISQLQQQLQKFRAVNVSLLHKVSSKDRDYKYRDKDKNKYQHKRTCSDQGQYDTFIFNQTNISSYFPVNMNMNTSPSPIPTPTSIKPPSTPHSTPLSTPLSTPVSTPVFPKLATWTLKTTLRSHLDSVRVLYWLDSLLISGGQDCLLKVWSWGCDRPRLTIRQHFAPIFAIAGDRDKIFTGGAQGVVRMWRIGDQIQAEEKEREEREGRGRADGEGDVHQDAIWELAWDSVCGNLITSSADSYLRILKPYQNQFVEKGYFNLYPQIPTSISLLQPQKLACGYAKVNKLSIFQLEKQKKCGQIGYHPRIEGTNGQINKLINCFIGNSKILISGHQDCTIRLFDPNSNKLIKSIAAHSDSITSLCSRLAPECPNPPSASLSNSSISHSISHPSPSSPSCSPLPQLISTSHDGTLRIWDLRRYKCIHDIGVPMQKYDQSLLTVAYTQIGNYSVIAVGGADGQIKIIGEDRDKDREKQKDKDKEKEKEKERERDSGWGN